VTGRAVVFTPLLDTGPPGLRDVGKLLTIRSLTFKSGGVNRRPRQLAPPSQAPFALPDHSASGPTQQAKTPPPARPR